MYRAILKKLIAPKALNRLEQKCTFDSENKKWTVPRFSVNDVKQVSFPKLKLFGSKSELPEATASAAVG